MYINIFTYIYINIYHKIERTRLLMKRKHSPIDWLPSTNHLHPLVGPTLLFLRLSIIWGPISRWTTAQPSATQINDDGVNSIGPVAFFLTTIMILWWATWTF